GVGAASWRSVRGRARSDRRDQVRGADLEGRGRRERRAATRRRRAGAGGSRRAGARRRDAVIGAQPMSEQRLTHVDEAGDARMVAVGAKDARARVARARARVRLSSATARAVAAGDAPKGEVLATARLAGIQAAKQTGQL